MKTSQKIKKILDKSGINYEVLKHRCVYTAYDLAQTLKREMSEIAKSLVLKVGDAFLLAVVPADHNIDLKKIQTIISKSGGKAVKVEIPTEKIMQKFVDFKKEAVSSFGSVYQLPVYLEKKLIKNKKFVLGIGDFLESVEMAVKDFIASEKPIVANFSVKKKIKKTKKVISKKNKVKKQIKKIFPKKKRK